MLTNEGFLANKLECKDIEDEENEENTEEEFGATIEAFCEDGPYHAVNSEHNSSSRHPLELKNTDRLAL